MWAKDAWYTCEYTCTPQRLNLPFSMPRKAYGPECNSNRCTQRWCYPQQLCKGNGLGIGRGVVAAAVPMAGSVVSNVGPWGWFIVRTCWLKMCRIVTKHPGDGEESSPLPVFPNVLPGSKRSINRFWTPQNQNQEPKIHPSRRLKGDAQPGELQHYLGRLCQGQGFLTTTCRFWRALCGGCLGVGSILNWKFLVWYIDAHQAQKYNCWDAQRSIYSSIQ